MSTQPEALRLADALDAWDAILIMPDGWRQRTSAELRRQHEENAELREANETFGRRQVWWNDRMFALEQQRDALLEALKEAEFVMDDCPMVSQQLVAAIAKARAAIKAVEEGK